MTKDERDMFAMMENLMYEIRNENNKFKETTNQVIEELKNKVDQKHIPISLEQQILQATQVSIGEAIKKVLSDSYNNPLSKMINNVINSYEKDITNTLSKILKESIQREELEGELKNALINKVSRALINGVDGGVDKVVNQLKNDPVFKSELLLAVNKIVNDFNKGSEIK